MSSFSTASYIKALKPKVYDIYNDLLNIKEELQNNGFVVIRALEASESKFALKEFENWIKALDPRIDLENPTREYFPDNIMGIIKSYGIGHAPFMTFLRSNKNVKEAFASVLGCKSDHLICSFDGACYMPWQFAMGSTKLSLWPHRDQSPLKDDFMTYQGSINLKANNQRGDGGFVVWPGTHMIKQWCSLLPNAECTWKSFFEIPHQVEPYVTVKTARRLVVPIGSLTLWDSRLIHCNVTPTGGGRRNRVVAYICMADVRMASNAILHKLELCKINKKSTSHNPLDFTINEDRVAYS